MENQTSYERACANAWRVFLDKHEGDIRHERDIRKALDDAFVRDYRSGFVDAKAEVEAGNARYIEPPMPSVPETNHIPDATKKVDRTMIAAMAMQGLLSNSTVMVEMSMAAKRSIETKAASPEAAEVSELAIKTAAAAAVRYADALIDELNKTEQ